MDIVQVDVRDEARLAEFHAVEAASVAHDRPHAVHRSLAALVATVREPGDYDAYVLLTAYDGPLAVGVAQLGFSTQDNLHLADLELHVHPLRRRRGVGSALLAEADRLRRAAGRDTLLLELYLPAEVEESSPGWCFALEHGFASVHLEHHLVLDLPVASSVTAGLATRVAATSADYDLVTWAGPCPEELVASYCAMKSRMSADVPIGDIDYLPPDYTVARLRAEETRLAKSYHQVQAVARRRDDGELGGYSQLALAHGSTQVIQDDTLVMPDHRGHRLGTAMKLATLEVVRRDHPERLTLHTWTAPGNAAMYRTNTDFGYVVAERMHEVQRKDR